MTVAARLSAILIALLIAACAGPRATRAEALPARSAEAAVRLAVEARGETYAGDCAVTRSPVDIGKVCSKLAAEQGGMRAYLVGRTFSEFSTWVFVVADGEEWAVAGTAPLDFFAAPDVPWP